MTRQIRGLIAAAAALMLSGTALPALAQDDSIDLVGLLQNTQDPFWTTIGCGASERAAELGVNLQLFTATTMDAAAVQASFNAAMLTRPDGYFGYSPSVNMFATQYQEMMANGVPVVTNAATEPPAHLRLIWSSPDPSGFIDDLLALIPEGEGKMLVLGGLQGLAPLESRYLPVVEAIAAARPGLTEVERIYSTFDINKATSGVAAALIANPDLRVIIASNGPDGVGAAAAVKAAGLAGQVTIIAFDAVPPQVEALREGTITALIAQPAAEIGAASVEALVDYLRGGHSGPVPVSSEVQGLPQHLLTQANIDSPEAARLVYRPSCE